MSLSPDSKNFLTGLLIGHAASRRYAECYAERYAAMTPAERQRQMNREGCFWAVVMLFVVFPGATCLIAVLLFLAVVLLFFTLFSVVSALAPLFWLAGFLAPLWLFTTLWRTAFRGIFCNALDALFSGALGAKASADKTFLAFAVFAVLFLTQLGYGILFCWIFPFPHAA
jgi:hypothetical protein